MGKGNKKANQRNLQAKSTSPAVQPNGHSSTQVSTQSPSLEIRATMLYDEAFSTAKDEDLETQALLPPVVSTSLAQAIQKAEDARALFVAQKDRAATADIRARDKEAMAARELEKAATRRQEVDQGEREVESRNKELLSREKSLREREEQVKKAELEAEEGFLADHRDWLNGLELEARRLREELAQQRVRLSDERVSFEQDLAEERLHVLETEKASLEEKRHSLEQERLQQGLRHLEKQRQLDEERERLEKDWKTLRGDRQRLRWEQEDVEELKRRIDERIEEQVAKRTATLQDDASFLRDSLAQARIDRNRLRELLDRRTEADQLIGRRSPDELLQEIESLKQERDELLVSLAERPGPEATERLRKLESEREQWELERYRLIEENRDLRLRFESHHLAAIDLERLRDQKRALESSNALLRAALEDLRKDVDERIRSSEGKAAFPECSAMDARDALQTRRPLLDRIDDLKSFVTDLQHRIAYDPQTSKELYYSIRDVRSLLAGLAMSRLHLLQGISGTGKTSLPQAFARAIGAGCEVIEVQAGWRDRQDLLGHFNAFEGKYYESEFLQTLYKAHCPFYADLPFIVLLDEMNLSHPEQYFADLLSALEQDPHLQRLHLMTAAVPAPPKHLEDGRTLPLPPNVWFVGTANHDETTVDFADKTYDRAHVMELPRHRAKFEYKKLAPRVPVALAAIKDAFKRARLDRVDEAIEANAFLDDQFADFLGQTFRIGWGNRLERQMQHYVPVVLASGGSMSEALDHILATKLLRKIRNRHENREDDLSALQRKVDAAWRAFGNEEPELSRQLIEDELRRIGGSQDDLHE